MNRTRKECYDYIKAHKKLQAKIYNSTLWYYQNLTTAELNDFVEADYNSLINKIKRFFGK
jgi:hypothetical protein